MDGENKKPAKWAGLMFNGGIRTPDNPLAKGVLYPSELHCQDTDRYGQSEVKRASQKNH